MTPVHGNKEVVAMLRKWADLAERDGQINYASLALCSFSDERLGSQQAAWDVAGSIEMEESALQAIDAMRARVKEQATQRTLPKQNAKLGRNYVVYNGAAAPINFDFLPWIVLREMERRRAGAPAPLKVHVWFGRDGDLVTEARKRLFHNVVVPCIKLVGGELCGLAKRGYRANQMTYKPICDSYLKGEQVPTLNPPFAAGETIRHQLAGARPITITLREADHHPHRNSNLDAWKRLACDLEKEGERVIFIRDTAKAQDPLAGFLTHPQASIDLYTRLALYQHAKANLFISNGPYNLCLFSGAPWLMFNRIDASDTYYPNTPEWWRLFTGLWVGGQFPWSRPDQRLVWAGDSYEELSKAWDDYAPLVRQAIAA